MAPVISWKHIKTISQIRQIWRQAAERWNPNHPVFYAKEAICLKTQPSLLLKVGTPAEIRLKYDTPLSGDAFNISGVQMLMDRINSLERINAELKIKLAEKGNIKEWKYSAQTPKRIRPS